MRKAVVVLVGLALILGFSGIVVADGAGYCSYQQQAKQVASDKSEAEKSQAAQSTDKSGTRSEADRFVLALDQADPSKPAAAQKK